MFDFGITTIIASASVALWGAAGQKPSRAPTVRFEPLPPSFATPPPLPSPQPSPQAANLEQVQDAPPQSKRRAAPPPPKRVIRERAPRYEPDRRVVDIHEAVDILINFMNELDMYGLYAAHEIDEFWYDCCAVERLVHMDGKLIREGLTARKLKVGDRRLNMPVYIHIRERTGKARLMLYRIPKRRVGAGDVPEDTATFTDVPDHNPALVPDHLVLQPGDPAFLRPSARPPVRPRTRQEPGAPGVHHERERKVA